MDYRELSDEQVMAHMAAGQESALEVLYDRYAAAVMGLALKIIRDRKLAEEIVQETFYRVWDSKLSFQTQRGNFTSWLFRIARNLAIDTWRRYKVRPEAVQNEQEEIQMARTPDSVRVDEAAWAMIRHKQVRAAMMSLPSEQREVIEMAYFAGKTRQEIANETGIALGTVHTRARLGLKKLRHLLQAQGIEE